jgi:hypothetical protein
MALMCCELRLNFYLFVHTIIIVHLNKPQTLPDYFPRAGSGCLQQHPPHRALPIAVPSAFPVGSKYRLSTQHTA